MKLTKSNIEKLKNCQFKIILPRLESPESPAVCGNGSVKRNERKRGRNRLSNRSDKENVVVRGKRPYQPLTLNLIKIDEVMQAVRQQNAEQLELDKTDRELLQAFNRNRKTTYTKIDKITIGRLETERNGVKSLSKSVHVSHSTSNNVGTSHSSEIEVQTVTSSQDKCVTRRSKRVLKDSRNVEQVPKVRNSKKMKLSQLLPQTDSQNEHTNKPTSSNALINQNNDVEEIIRSHSSHICANKIDQKINDVQLTQTPDGTFVRRDFVIRIKQYCVNQPTTVAVPQQSNAVVSSTTKQESINKSTTKTQRGVTVEQTIGINLRTKTKSMEKNCTKIVHSKYTETVEKRNRKKLDKTSPVVTRRRAASKNDNEFFSLPYRKNAIFTSDKIETSLLENSIDKHSTDKPLGKDKNNNSRRKSYTVTGENLESAQNKEVQLEATPSCSYTIPLSITTQSCSIDLLQLETIPEEPIEKLVLKEISVNHRKSARLAKKTSKKIQLEKEKKDLREKQKKPVIVETNEKPRNTRKSTKTSCNTTSTDSLNLPQRRGRPPANLQNEVDSTTRTSNRISRVKSTPKRYLSDDENEILSPRKKKTKYSTPIIELSDDEEWHPREKKRMSKKIATQKAQKFNEHRKSLETSTRKSRSKKTPVAGSSSTKKPTKRSTKAQNESTAGNSSRYPLNVTFAETTPQDEPRRKGKKHIYSSLFTPCSVVLDRLDPNDISIYAITPLREERARPPPKTSEDYGIDDVNTDDSTDDEDDPKKIPPEWVKTIAHQCEVQFRVSRDMVKNWIRPPKTPFTVKSLFF